MQNIEETTLPTGWSMKHATKANVRTTTVFMIMTAITTHLKKCLKKEEKFFFRVKYQNVGIFCISKMSKNKDWEVYIKTHITTIKSKRKEKKQYRWQSIDTLVGSLDCSQETSRKRIAGGSNQDTGLYIACCALLTSDDSAKSLTSFQCNKGSINKHKRGSINQLLLGIWRKNQPG